MTVRQACSTSNSTSEFCPGLSYTYLYHTVPVTFLHVPCIYVSHRFTNYPIYRERALNLPNVFLYWHFYQVHTTWRIHWWSKWLLGVVSILVQQLMRISKTWAHAEVFFHCEWILSVLGKSVMFQIVKKMVTCNASFCICKMSVSILFVNLL